MTMRANKERKTPRLCVEAYWGQFWCNFYPLERVEAYWDSCSCHSYPNAGLVITCVSKHTVFVIFILMTVLRSPVIFLSLFLFHKSQHNSETVTLSDLCDQHRAVCRVDWRANTGENSSTNQQWQAFNVVISSRHCLWRLSMLSLFDIVQGIVYEGNKWWWWFSTWGQVL